MPYQIEILCTRHDEDGTNNHRLQIVTALISGIYDSGCSTLKKVHSRDDRKGFLYVY